MKLAANKLPKAAEITINQQLFLLDGARRIGSTLGQRRKENLFERFFFFAERTKTAHMDGQGAKSYHTREMTPKRETCTDPIEFFFCDFQLGGHSTRMDTSKKQIHHR